MIIIINTVVIIVITLLLCYILTVQISRSASHSTYRVILMTHAANILYTRRIYICILYYTHGVSVNSRSVTRAR